MQHQKKMFCLLDVFIYPNYQRQGHGKRMINAMMEDQQLQALFKMEQQICSEL
jgi:GNAT superfamily N-acetyltransferase